MPNARNVDRFLDLAGFSVGAEVVPHEPNPKTSTKWTPQKVAVLKYVDDGVQLEKINMETAQEKERDGKKIKVKHAIPSQNVFRFVLRKATSRGMKVNALKTSVLCISDALATTSEAYIEDGEGNVLTSGDGIKMLGFHMDRRPSVGAHIEALRKRFRSRTWILMHLKHAGFNTEELSKVYRVIVRPVADYMQVVYHSMMTDRQDEVVERLQSQALKIIFGKDKKYADMRKLADVTTLRARRIAACDKFAEGCASGTFARWFPLRVGVRATRGSTRAVEKYEESFARCNRLYNSPLYYMRRRLNGKPGKVYGQRNREYRDN